MTFRNYLKTSALCFLLLSCSKNSTDSAVTVTATNASAVITKVNGGVQGAGTGMGKTAAAGNAIAQLDKNLFQLLVPKAYAAGGGINSVCNNHAQPLNGDGVTRLNNTDADYPAMVFFCTLAQNTHDPDTIQGSYEMVNAIACALKNAGLTWDGADHTVTMTVDSTCFSAQQISNIGTSSMTITSNASQPASFNTHYDAGIIMTVPNFGIFKVATKVTGTKIEFLVLEDQNSITANKTGSYAAAFDSSSGNLWFEARHDRFFASTTGSCGNSCGWSRHIRILANMTMDAAGNPNGLVSVQGVSAALGTNTGPSYSSDINTISGDMTNGLKARNYANTVINSQSALADGASYTEHTNTKCYLANSSAGTGCGTGIQLTLSGTANFPFSQAGASYTSPTSWMTGLTTGLSFTTVTFADVQ
ncbi:MAG: hypothetical protein ACXVCP_12175 [Bdellovibrio sp.]